MMAMSDAAPRGHFNQRRVCLFVFLELTVAALMCPALAGEPANEGAPSAVESNEAQEKPRFDLMDLQVDGNTVLETEEIENAVYRFVGPGKSIDDVEKARQALENTYHQKGYATVLVEIPEQDVDGGVVRLQVVEGTVEQVQVTGSRYYSLGKIREAVPALQEGQVPHMPTVEAQMAKLAEESADRSVTPIFRAGSTPGKMEVEMRVKDQLPLHGGLEINGRNTEFTTRSRLIGSLRYDNLWQKFHSASLQYQVSPENSDEVEVWSGTYVMPTGFADTRLAMYGIGISSNTDLGAAVGGTSVVGTGLIFGARLVKPLPAVTDYMHSLSAGFDYKDFDQGVTLVGQDTGNTPIRYVPFTVAYDGTWRGEDRVTSINLGGHFSIRGLGNDQQEFEDKRFKSSAAFFYFTTELKHQQALPYDLRLLGRASAQVANSPLISNEQFAVGGPQSVRGYHQTQQLGDNGVNLSLELQSPRLTPEDWTVVENLRVHAFFDWAYLWILDALPSTPSHYQLAATGLGLRTQIFRHFIGEFDWGYPFYQQGTVGVGENRIDFRLAYEF